MEVALLAVGIPYGLCYLLTAAKLAAFYYYCGKSSPADLPGAAGMLRLFFIESNITAAIVLLRLLPPRKRRLSGGGASTAGPVVILCHGYLMDASCFLLLRRRLRRAGCETVYGVSLPRLLAPLERLAQYLAEDMHRVITANPGREIVIVAHSMGGIVARAALATEPALAAATSLLITLGSPHHGTAAARFAPGRNAREMQPGSRFLASLDSGATPVPMLCLYSRVDNVVFPGSTAQAPGAAAVEIERVGHMGLLVSKRLAEVVVDAIWKAASRGPRANVA